MKTFQAIKYLSIPTIGIAYWLKSAFAHLKTQVPFLIFPFILFTDYIQM